MIYKFNTGSPELDRVSIELEVDVDQITINTQILDEHCPEQFRSQTHYLNNYDLDNLILALTELKREIFDNRREMNK